MRLLDVLAIPEFDRATFEVGLKEPQLEQPVNRAFVAELPLSCPSLQKGDLVFVSALAFPDGETETRRVLRDIAIASPTAIVIKAEDGDGSRVLDAAIEMDLPVIALEPSIEAAQLMAITQRAVEDENAGFMTLGEEVRRNLTARIVAGADVKEILEETATDLERTLYLEKEGHGLFLDAGVSSGDPANRAAWYAFQRGHRGASDALMVEVPGSSGPWGQIITFVEPGQRRRAEIVLREVAGLISLAVLHNRDDGRLIARDRYEFLTGLMDGVSSEARTSRRANRYGWVEGRRILPVAGAIDESADGGSHELERIWSDLETAVLGHRMELISGSDPTGRCVLMLIALREDSSREWTADLLVSEVKRSIDRHLEGEADAMFCVGDAVADFTSASGELLRAREAVRVKQRIGEKLPPRGWFDSSRDDFDQFLWSLRDQPELERYSSRRLASLTSHDAEGRINLIETLAAYCDSGGQKSAAADTLCIERQSLYHRLSKIESLLGVDLDDGRTLTELSVALKIRRILGSDLVAESS